MDAAGTRTSHRVLSVLMSKSEGDKAEVQGRIPQKQRSPSRLRLAHLMPEDVASRCCAALSRTSSLSLLTLSLVLITLPLYNLPPRWALILPFSLGSTSLCALINTPTATQAQGDDGKLLYYWQLTRHFVHTEIKPQSRSPAPASVNGGDFWVLPH